METLPNPMKNIVTQEVPEGAILLQGNGNYLVLNATGQKVWEAIQSGWTYQQLIRDLITLQNAPEESVCKVAVNHFLAELEKAGFTYGGSD